MASEPVPLDVMQPNEGGTPDIDTTKLVKFELFWRDHQPWLEEKGYMLRPRYKPGWVASWSRDESGAAYEDGIPSARGQILDATRISDGEMVILKKVSRRIHPHETEITRFFTTEPWSSHPRNHCVPLYDAFDVPELDDTTILVIPLLRPFNDPRFESVGEAVEFFRQMFEGLQFMHQCHVAHRDCMRLNIMMDPRPTFPEMFHPRLLGYTRNFKRGAKHYTRTSRPTMYYLIDFGLSRQYDPEDDPPLELPIWGGDRSVPEFNKSDEACDPFPTDIYYLGNVIRKQFLQTTRGVEFMKPLVEDMVQDEPTQRPTINEVVERFNEIQHSLQWWKLRSRLVETKEAKNLGVVTRVGRTLHHVIRTVGHILTGRSALPSPPLNARL